MPTENQKPHRKSRPGGRPCLEAPRGACFHAAHSLSVAGKGGPRGAPEDRPATEALAHSLEELSRTPRALVQDFEARSQYPKGLFQDRKALIRSSEAPDPVPKALVHSPDALARCDNAAPAGMAQGNRLIISAETRDCKRDPLWDL